MSNKERVLWGMFAGVLVLLFLLSSTDLIIKEKKQEVYVVSVLVADASDEYYINFRKGMDKAAEKLHVDVSFVSLYYDHSAEEQIDLLQREIRDGAEAVILAPVNETEIVMKLDEMSPNCPIVLLGSSAVSDCVSSTLSIDGYETGRALAEKIAGKESADIPVYIFSSGLSYTGAGDLYDGVRSALEEAGFAVSLVEREDSDTFRSMIEGTVYPGSSEMTIIALDTASLGETASVMEGSSVYREHVAGLYGIGCTTGILRQMDRGIITGLMVSNQYDMGYRSVQSAVDAARGIHLKEQMEMETYYIEKNDLRNSEYEQLLYPIE